ncbi:MAG TPA: hypothetical protein VN772_05635 [Solirubrobacteraceae bacterium]|nr:hypothetical protein [Solirubrobacteraceae bacterium]
MAQISRPFQIALLAIVLLAGVWLFALQGHSSSPSSSASAPAPAPAASAPTPPKASAPTSTYHGSAPGVAGLTSAIAKAKGAVAISQQNAKQLAEKSAQASSPTSSPTQTASSQPAPAAVSTSAAGASATTRAPATPASKTVVPRTTPVKPSGPATLARQRQVEAQLKSGDVVLVLFWDRKGADDLAVQRAVRSLQHGQAKLAVYQALASEVASFGSVTRGVQVYGTPTLLIVGRHGQTIVITGLTDVYSIRQAIGEARGS